MIIQNALSKWEFLKRRFQFPLVIVKYLENSLHHTGLDLFQIPLEYYISDFLIFYSSHEAKVGKEKKSTSFGGILSYQLMSTADLAHHGWIGCANWLVTQKATEGSWFSFLSSLPQFHILCSKISVAQFVGPNKFWIKV